MLDTDNPSDRIDHYRRGALAQRITRALKHPLSNDSVVIALDGPWGSGKSWLLDQVEKNLQDKNQSASAVVVRFNPWQIGEESDLILEFLVQVALETRPIQTAATGVIDKSKKVGQTLIKYARVLSYCRHLKYIPVPILKEFGELIDDNADNLTEKFDAAEKALDSKEKETPSLGQARDAAKEAIADLGKRLIIMIDDIDRLRSREIRAVMQLVKSVLDFPNTSFLLAFDSEQVARALAEDGDQDRGMRYLEKIIQLSINVPPLDRQLIFEDVKARFSQALEQTGHTLRPYEEPLMDEALRLVAGLCDTPRDVVRWANRLVWTLDALRSSVNAADLCVIEMLYLKLSKESWLTVVNFQSPHEAIQDQGNYHIIKKQTTELTKEDIKKIFSPQREWAAVKFLFLSIISNYSDMDAQPKRRLHNDTVWAHYLRHSTGSATITGADADHLLAHPDELRDLVENLCHPDKFPAAIDTISEITSFLSFSTIPDNTNIIDSFVIFINFAHENTYSSKGNLATTYLSELASDLLLSLINHNKASQAIDLTTRLPVLISTFAIEQITKNPLLWSEPDETHKNTIQHLKQASISRLALVFSEDRDNPNKNHVPLIYAYARLTSWESAADTLEKMTDTDEKFRAILESSFDHQDFMPPHLIEFTKNPEHFIERVAALKEDRLASYLACLRKIPAEEIDAIKAKSNQPS